MGIPLSTSTSASKSSKRNRKNYPLSWGAAPENMHMKKRVLCVFDGPRRLWKDDMMLDVSRHEVRVPLQPGAGTGAAGSYVSDLDILTMARAEALLNATEEEKGPWVDEEGRKVLGC